MKRLLTVNTRWEYYASNIAGMIIVLSLVIWFATLSLDHGQVRLDSIFLWLGCLLLIIFPFALISFFSSMKSVTVTEKGLLIAWSFKKHVSEVIFADVREFKSNVHVKETVVRPGKITDSFRLILKDGRAFEFSRSQFGDYNKLKAVVYKGVQRVT
jgi:hypothetical protein